MRLANYIGAYVMAVVTGVMAAIAFGSGEQTSFGIAVAATLCFILIVVDGAKGKVRDETNSHASDSGTAGAADRSCCRH